MHSISGRMYVTILICSPSALTRDCLVCIASIGIGHANEVEKMQPSHLFYLADIVCHVREQDVIKVSANAPSQSLRAVEEKKTLIAILFSNLPSIFLFFLPLKKLNPCNVRRKVRWVLVIFSFEFGDCR